MGNAAASPRITDFSWGRLDVEGHRRFKDAKLFPGGAEEWDWNETGTRHAPGIQCSDVEGLLTRGATVVILSKGIWGRLQICPETLEMLERRGIVAHALPTKKAVQLYNQLREEQPVGALIHSTC